MKMNLIMWKNVVPVVKKFIFLYNIYIFKNHQLEFG